jgi:hypothetical protein
VPRIRRLRPVEVRDVKFLRANTERVIKIIRSARSQCRAKPKYISRDIAFAKLNALAKGAAIVRRELTGG